MAVIAIAATLPGYARGQDAPAAADGKEVDAPTKKLMGAHGLFQRRLYKLAAQQYEQFLQQYPQHKDVTAARYALSLSRYRLGEHEAAIALLGEVLKDEKFAQRDEALAVLGHSHLARQEHDKALAALDELLAKHPQSKHAEVASLNRAQVLYFAGKRAEALAACDAYLKRFPQGPGRPAAMYFQALSQRGLDQNKAAADTLRAMLNQFPENPYKLDATLLLGQALEADNQLEPAAGAYREVVTMAPASRKADGQYSLGVALYKAGKYDDAIKELRTVVTDHAGHKYAKPAHLQLARAQLAGGRVGEARQTFQLVAQNDKDRAADATYGLAQCELAEKKWAQARAVLDQLAAANPPPGNLEQVLLDRALCQAQLDKFAEAAAEFGEFRKKYPQSKQIGEATYREAFALHKLGKFDESRRLAEGIAQPAPELVDPIAELQAENLFLLGKYPEAQKGFAELLAKTKDADDDRAMRFTLRLGQAAYYTQNYDEAVKRLGPLSDKPKVGQDAALRPAIFLYGDALLQQGKHKEAAAALAKYVAVAEGDKREAQFKQGLAQLRADDPAAEQTLAAVANGPGDSPWATRAQFEYGQLLYKKGSKPEAAAALNKVMAANPPAELAAPAAYLLGWVDFDAKRYAEAAQRWGQLLQQHPGHALAADATFQRGVALREAGQHAEALAAFQAYAGANPEGQHRAKAMQLSAASQTALGQHDAAAKTLAALADDEKLATDAVLYDLAWARRALKDTAGAQASYQRLLKQFPQSKLTAAARTELAELLYADGKHAEAATLLEAVVADKAADPRTLTAASYRLAWCYDKLEQPGKAAAAFATFAAAHPDDPLAATALLQAGASAAEEGKFDAAAKSLSEMLAKFPQHEQAPVALLKLGEAQAEMNEFAASQQSFARFLEQHPRSEFAYRAQFGVAWALENQKQYEPARAAYRKVIDAHNGETAARSQFQIGETFFAEGKFEEAVAELLQVEDVYAYPAWSARALLEAGRAFEQLEQHDRAREQYTALVEKYKDSPEAKLARERLAAMKDVKPGAQS
jgi:TolA-binding protein